jgi:hypothetical protein
MFGLLLYWLPIYYICSTPVWLPAYRLGLAVFCYACGVFLHFSSDMYKCVFIEYRERLQSATPSTDDRNNGKNKRQTAGSYAISNNILREKMWKHLRNPNYFGELLIYGSFVSLGNHWVPCCWLAVMVIGYLLFPHALHSVAPQDIVNLNFYVVHHT